MAQEATATTEDTATEVATQSGLWGAVQILKPVVLNGRLLPSRFRNGRISSSRNATRILLNCALRLVYCGTSSRFGGRGVDLG